MSAVTHRHASCAQAALLTRCPVNVKDTTVVGGTLYTVNSKKLEYGSGTIYVSFPSSLGFGVGGTVIFQGPLRKTDTLNHGL